MELLAKLYAVFIPVNLTTLVMLGSLTGMSRFRRFNGLRSGIFALIAAALTALHVFGALSVATAVATYLGANVIVMIAAAFAVRTAVDGPIVFAREYVRLFLAFGAKVHAGAVSSTVNQRLDQLLISIFLASSQLGLDVVAVTLTSATILIGSSIEMVALPALSSVAGEAHRLGTRAYLITGIALSLAVTAPLLVLAPRVIRWFFGTAFEGAASCARVLLVGAVFLSLGRIATAALAAAGRPLAAGAGEAIALVVTLVLLPILLPAYGLIGAAVASAVAYATSLGWSTRRLHRSTGPGAHAPGLKNLGPRPVAATRE